MSSPRKALAIKRINKDIREITKNPIEGIGIAQLGNDIMNYIINMRLMTGPYEGYCLQLLLTFFDNYPTKPPKILIFPGQAINEFYHHHIFNDMRDENGLNYKKFCFDLLDNEFMSTTDEHTGWNPSYSISSLLLQVQNFISNPDKEVPSKYYIDQLMDSMNHYQRSFLVQTEKGFIEKIHTWKDPYPEMYFKKDDENNKIKEKEKEKNEDKKKEEEYKMQIIKENLSCFMLKVNYIDDPDILLGYPIILKRGFGKNKIELYPIPELLTYEGFLTQVDIQGQMVDMFFNLKSANNEFYNNWLPIYINKEHYEKNKQTILNSINNIIIRSNINIYNINNNMQINSFKPEQIFQVLPMILNSMIIGLFTGKITCSSSFIRCYFQYILLFKKFCVEFEGDYLDYLNMKFNEIKKNNYTVTKEIIPDIGNFFILILFCSLDTNSESMNKIYNSLYEDSLNRQMFWMFHSEEKKDSMKKLLLKSEIDNVCLKNFEENPDFKMKNLDKFNDDLKDKKIYDEIVNIICQDKEFLDHIFIGKDKVKGQVESRMSKSFKRLFTECSKEGKKQIGEIISKNLEFSNYFDMNKIIEYEDYDNFKIDEILKNKKINNIDEIIRYAFSNQRGNQLYIITFFAQKKVEEPGFLEDLEKNYGVYLDVDNFIKDMNQKLKEIKTYTDFYKYVGTEFGKDKTDLELIIDAYKKAKEKGYIRTKRSLSNTINSQLINSRNLINNNVSRDFNGNSRNDWRNRRSRNSSSDDSYSSRDYNRNSRNFRNERRNRSRSRSSNMSESSYSSRIYRNNNYDNRRRRNMSRSWSRERRGRHYRYYRDNYRY